MIILACKRCGCFDLKEGICCPNCSRELKLYEVHFVLITRKELKERLENDNALGAAESHAFGDIQPNDPLS